MKGIYKTLIWILKAMPSHVAAEMGGIVFEEEIKKSQII
jgi:hypothetical protein